MHYYQFHAGDYLKDTAHLSPMEDLAYRRLLDMYYDTEAPIPLETQSVSRRLRLDNQVVESVLKEFFKHTADGWRNLRCDEEIAEYHAKCERNRANGKLGGRRKKTQSVPTGNPELTQNEANHKPLTINQEPIKQQAQDKPARFDPLALDLPACIPADAWANWIAYRRENRWSVKERTVLGQIEKLVAWAKDGIRPEDALKEAISNGHQGLYPPKNRGSPSFHDERAATLAGLTGGNRNATTSNERDITAEAERIA